MKYISTRGGAEELSFEEVLLSGLARDGGLYVPKQWPKLSFNELELLGGYSYQDIAFKIMKPFIGSSFSDEEFKGMIVSAYASFNHDAICPLVQLSNDHFLLELFHGPTLAFKDVAMQLIGQMFDNILRKTDSRATVVAATSGDTGSAAMEAFCNSSYVDVFILFPEGRISEVQRRQMTTLDKPNIHALAVKGDFDDCQAVVKKMFNNFEFRDRVRLTGVNSINWARIMSQIVYFFSSALCLGAPYKKVSFTVPTGNFGDIFAAYAAKKMGLPINKLIIATNENDILHRTLLTGSYRKQGLVQTISPSMDIQVSSNFERLLFDLSNNNGELVKSLMHQLTCKGKFDLNSFILKKFRENFLSGSVTEREIENTMNSVLKDCGELICPHTAIGVNVAKKENSFINDTTMITLATAHPAKFPDAVTKFTGRAPVLPSRYSELFSRKEVMISVNNSVDQIQRIISERTLH